MNYLLAVLLCFCSAAFAIADSKTPQRIIALAPHITEMLYAVGAAEQVIAVSDFSDYPQQAQLLPRVANFAGVNIEAVLALKPDLVIAWRSGTPVAFDRASFCSQSPCGSSSSQPLRLTARAA